MESSGHSVSPSTIYRAYMCTDGAGKPSDGVPFLDSTVSPFGSEFVTLLLSACPVWYLYHFRSGSLMVLVQ